MLINDQEDYFVIAGPPKKVYLSPAFKAVGRSHSTIHSRFYGVANGIADLGSYKPDFERVRPRLGTNSEFKKIPTGPE